ncbi:MAG TPA: CDP-diacylglycerol--glycerol-3-phosphate 3-phosphatidyltransferase [Thermogutta sp.]|nr:CDP-diacylglycerol--glycerol-3-phosphate 3-phosphatidyltransferase [Thermogutta sp.]HOP77801.1 CDP-diacylglycerol--glycerol-3-phosphate 3-phosphatidyltransferase [Thermogutta sp.]HPU06213.1 CDP-diacylglycerol--glycerol-3-phosphate 3-phosphatidyltransferase [Thermogutta sp.]HQF13664.1 CDP-diacylglycerol--glycerol-3-phosphate 3-phosphatidyltransferase [Thermogutta sp.]
MSKMIAGTSPRWFNLPNCLTLLRILLAVALFVTLSIHERVGYGVSIGLFIVAAATDWLDGFLARRLNLVTALGRILDPFADKLIICGTFVFLAATPKMIETPWGLHPWIVVVVISRELLITGLRSFLEGQTVDFSAKFSGKLKMGFQCITAVVAMMYLADTGYNTHLSYLLWLALVVSTYLTLLTTVYSGIAYIMIGWKKVRDLEAAG